MGSTQPYRATFVLTLAILLAPSCRSKRYLVGFELPAGEEAEVLVEGKQLRIQVVNEGPGTVLITFDTALDARDGNVKMGAGTVTRSMPGPVRLRCANVGEVDTQIDVRAWGTNGLSLDQTPAPARALSLD